MTGRYQVYNTLEGRCSGRPLFSGSYDQCKEFTRNLNNVSILLLEPMITALAPLGKTHSIQILPDFDGEQVTVTVLLKPKDSKAKDKVIPLQFKGTAAEVDLMITTELTQAVDKLVQHRTDMTRLDEVIAAETKAKEKELTAAKEKKPTVAAKAAAKSKPATKAKPASKPTAKAKPGAKKTAPAKPAPGKGKLTPAPRGKRPVTSELPLETPAATEPPEVDFGALFPEDGVPAATAS